MQNSALKYKDENDRSMGLAGSAIALVIWDGEDKLAAIDLDSLPGEGMEMTPDFSFAGNPRLSARLAWQMMLKQLELTSAMVMGNVLCRSYVGQGRQPSSSARAALRAMPCPVPCPMWRHCYRSSSTDNGNGNGTRHAPPPAAGRFTGPFPAVFGSLSAVGGALLAVEGGII